RPCESQRVCSEPALKNALLSPQRQAAGGAEEWALSLTLPHARSLSLPPCRESTAAPPHSKSLSLVLSLPLSPSLSLPLSCSFSHLPKLPCPQPWHRNVTAGESRDSAC